MTAGVDAIVVGAGPNGLVAAIELARAGLEVLVLEAADTPGGGARTAGLTLPGFRHDTCSGVHPLAVAAPALRDLPLARYGLEWVHAPLCSASSRLAQLQMATGSNYAWSRYASRGSALISTLLETKATMPASSRNSS